MFLGTETAEVQVENGSEAKDLIDLTKDAVVVDATIGKQKPPSEDKIDGTDKEEAPGIGDLISAGEEKAKAEEVWKLLKVTVNKGKYYIS